MVNAIAMTLHEYDTQTLYLSIANLREPLSEGLYRVCGLNRPHYQLEFVVSETAIGEHKTLMEANLSA